MLGGVSSEALTWWWGARLAQWRGTLRMEGLWEKTSSRAVHSMPIWGIATQQGAAEGDSESLDRKTSSLMPLFLLENQIYLKAKLLCNNLL